MAPLLSVKDLRLEIDTEDGLVAPVNGVSFSVKAGETLGLVGESGCGKSVTALSILRLLPSPPTRIAGGSIVFDGMDLATLSERHLRRLRGNRIAMVFQEPMTSLNPVLTVGEQIAEALRLHQKLHYKAAFAHAVEMLDLVGIPDPHRRAYEYPHQFSGGMRQRVVIAIALACRPDLLIADEPTTALDVTIQAQIMDLLMRLREELGMAMILITHDLGLVAEASDKVCVMYAGRIVESAPTRELFETPCHPYTQRLIRAVPRRTPGAPKVRLQEIPGSVPPLWDLPGGCGFCPRLEGSGHVCKPDRPPVHTISPNHTVSCWAAHSGAGGKVGA